MNIGRFGDTQWWK